MHMVNLLQPCVGATLLLGSQRAVNTSTAATLLIAETKPEFWRQGYGSQPTREGP